jgi:hypothetical protein
VDKDTFIVSAREIVQRRLAPAKKQNYSAIVDVILVVTVVQIIPETLE